ncbi:MAG: ATP-binding protein [Clostridium sp.]
MFKSSKTGKLFSYFAIALVSFSIVISMVFLVLFRNYAVEFHKQDMLKRATSISTALSSYMSGDTPPHGFGAYLKFLDDIAGSDVWIVDKDYRILSSSCCANGEKHIKGLPENSKNVINKVFESKNIYSEDFNSILSECSLTLGVPIKDSSSNVIGALLLHSPLNYSDSLMKNGITMLVGSLIIGLVLSFLLALWLSKRFTDPIILKEAEDAIRLDKIRCDFVANVSHELRTPITVIRGFGELLESGIVKDVDKIHSYTSQIVDESKYLQNMVNDLLDLSKLQNTDFPMEITTINFSDVVLDATRSQSKLCEDKNISINTNIESKTLAISGDYFRLRQLVLILLNNAIKFSPINSKIDINLNSNFLEIRDYGVGVEDDELPFIFDRFHKSRNENNKSGSGLGLAIAKQISDRHGFKIEGRKHSVGTSFIIRFDLKSIN